MIDKMTKEKMDALYPKSSMDKFLGSPILKFSYGIFYMTMGFVYLHTDILKEFISDLGIQSPLVPLMITGMCICAGFYYLSCYYDAFKKALQNFTRGIRD